MSVRTTPSYQSLDGQAEIPRPPLAARARFWLICLVIAALLAWGWGPVDMHKATGLVTDLPNMAEVISGFLQPNFYNWRQYAMEMIETVQIALWSTALAVVLGAPFAILASSNICPQVVVQPVRRLMDAFRA